jgi:hypothetical protein
MRDLTYNAFLREATALGFTRHWGRGGADAFSHPALERPIGYAWALHPKVRVDYRETLVAMREKLAEVQP